MLIKFGTNAFPVPVDEHERFDATTLSHAWAEAGGQANALKGWMASLDEKQIAKFCLISKRGRGGGTWVNKRGLLAFAAYCSEEFEDAVFEAFDELTKGNVFEAAVIVESVAVSPELIAKHDDTRKLMNTMIAAKGISMGGNAYSNFYRLACKAATGYVPSVLTGSNGTAKDFIKDAGHAPCMAALIATMETIIMGLKVGLDYHKAAAMLNVETTKNVDYFG